MANGTEIPQHEGDADWERQTRLDRAQTRLAASDKPKRKLTTPSDADVEPGFSRAEATEKWGNTRLRPKPLPAGYKPGRHVVETNPTAQMSGGVDLPPTDPPSKPFPGIHNTVSKQISNAKPSFVKRAADAVTSVGEDVAQRAGEAGRAVADTVKRGVGMLPKTFPDPREPSDEPAASFKDRFGD